ncbi:MAG TPA: hypothetical protein VFL17_04360 [Anaerolineae bacterium]|nr:hypothetical protein [Anaerolineae bacterium]
MFARYLTFQTLRNAVWLLLGALLMLVLLVGLVTARNAFAEGYLESAAASSAVEASGLAGDVEAPDAATWRSCVPVEVMVYTTGSKRMHVRCSAALSGILFHALGTSDSTTAARVLSVVTTAQAAGRTLSILYDPADTTSGPPIGCSSSDCRLILAVGFGQ